MKKYSKPTIKVVNINEESGICHSSNWYDRQDHGQSGAGGSTSGAGQASGVGQPSKTGTEVGLQAQGMALQLANVMSQTRLNESQQKRGGSPKNQRSRHGSTKSHNRQPNSADFKRKSEERAHLRTNQSSRCRRRT